MPILAGIYNWTITIAKNGSGDTTLPPNQDRSGQRVFL